MVGKGLLSASLFGTGTGPEDRAAQDEAAHRCGRSAIERAVMPAPLDVGGGVPPPLGELPTPTPPDGARLQRRPAARVGATLRRLVARVRAAPSSAPARIELLLMLVAVGLAFAAAFLVLQRASDDGASTVTLDRAFWRCRAEHVEKHEGERVAGRRDGGVEAKTEVVCDEWGRR